MTTKPISEAVELYQSWIEKIKQHQGHPVGCFFIFNETVQPYFWDDMFHPIVSLEDAWKSICEGWLNKVYSYNLIPLFPYVVKGVVDSKEVRLGNDCPFYLDDIKFNFDLASSDYVLDPTLSVDLNIPNDLAVMMRITHKESPYFERLPSRIQFRKKDYGSKLERSAALGRLGEKSQGIVKAKRFGSLPSLVKHT